MTHQERESIKNWADDWSFKHKCGPEELAVLLLLIALAHWDREVAAGRKRIKLRQYIEFEWLPLLEKEWPVNDPYRPGFKALRKLLDIME